MNIQWSLNEVEWNEVCRSNARITDCFREQDQRESKKHLWMKSNEASNTRNWFRSNKLEWIMQIDILKIWNIYIPSIFNIQKYFPMSLNEYCRNSILENCQWMLDLEDLHSIISNHFIITSHCQRTGITISSTKCILTECNGL